MSVTAQGSGSQAATVPTEHTLLDVAVAGTFQLMVDKSVMLAGDTLELRAYDKILSGGTLRVAYFQSYSGAQSANDMIAISVPISNDLVEAASLRFTLNQTAGSSRTFPWVVTKFA